MRKQTDRSGGVQAQFRAWEGWRRSLSAERERVARCRVSEPGQGEGEMRAGHQQQQQPSLGDRSPSEVRRAPVRRGGAAGTSEPGPGEEDVYKGAGFGSESDPVEGLKAQAG